MNQEVLLLLLLAYVPAGQPAGENVNAREYGVLCRLYRLAAAKFKKHPAYDKLELQKLLGQIKGIYINHEHNESYYKEHQGAVSGDVAKTCKRLPPSKFREVFSNKLKRIWENGEGLAKRIQKEEEQSDQAVETAHGELLEAIYGEGTTNKGDDTLTDTEKTLGVKKASGGTVANQCGGTGQRGGETDSKNVGISLINDFLCLCVGATGGSNDQPCLRGVVKDSGQANPFDSTAIGRTVGKWATLKNGCPHFQEDLTPEAIQSALSAFRATLGGQVGAGSDTHDAAASILGKIAAVATGCTGDNSAHQVCVNYVQKIKTGGPGIRWESHFREAVTELKKYETGKKKQEQLFEELRKLNATAWELCEDVWDEFSMKEGTRELRNSTHPTAAASSTLSVDGHKSIAGDSISGSSAGQKAISNSARVITIVLLMSV